MAAYFEGSGTWVKLLERKQGKLELHADGAALLKSDEGHASIALGLGASPLRATLSEPPTDDSVVAWAHVRPLATARGCRATYVELADWTSDDNADALCCLLLSASVVAYKAEGDAVQQLAPWECLGKALQAARYHTDRDASLEPEREGLREAMPVLLWCFSGDSEEGTAQRQLEKTVLASEKGFGEAESRRNNARLLLTSMFVRREACRDAFLERAADAARPKPCLGRAPTGNMVRREVEVLLDGLADCRKASLVDAWTAAVEELHASALQEATDAHARDIDEAERMDLRGSSLEAALKKAADDALTKFSERTTAVAPPPKQARKAPPVPTTQLRETMRQAAQSCIQRASQKASERSEKLADQALDALATQADSAINEDDEEGAPISRRAELWLQAYRGRLGSTLSDCLEKEPTSGDALGRAVSTKAPEAVEKRCKACLDTLTEERSSLLEDEAKHRLAAKRDEERLSEATASAKRDADGARQAVALRMNAIESKKVAAESLLHELDQQVESVVRGQERVDARLREKLDGAVARAAARADDVSRLQSRCVAEASEAVDACAGAQLKLADARLDTLRVRCVTLGHEKANLSEHMELLEEHLERLKADLDHKHAEVNEVEHQWSQTKAKLPSLKAKFGEADRRRATLADLARRLKAHIRDATRGGQLPRLLLNHLDPMERQALEDL